MPEVVVVGSLCQDLVVKAPRRPLKGETLRGTEFSVFVGGKGNNQALAAARAGAKVAMVGRVGKDQFGDMLIDTLNKNGVDSRFVFRDPDVGTGMACITIDGDGDNSIIIVQQANLCLSVDDIERASETIISSHVLLMQLEVPLEVDVAAAKLARRSGTTVILNPAPAPEDRDLPQELLTHVDIFIPNQTEAHQMTNIEVKDLDSAYEAAKILRDAGPNTIIITMAEQGAFVCTNDDSQLIPSFSVKAIDTTAAGDAFCGALAAALARGERMDSAVRWGCAAGALATTKMGAEPSLPERKEIAALANKVTVS